MAEAAEDGAEALGGGAREAVDGDAAGATRPRWRSWMARGLADDGEVDGHTAESVRATERGVVKPVGGGNGEAMAAVRRTEATTMRPSTRWNTGGLVEAATTVMLCGGC